MTPGHLQCPACHRPLIRRISQGLEAFVCDDHGVWQPWATVHALTRMALREGDDSDALIEGFLWGKLL